MVVARKEHFDSSSTQVCHPQQIERLDHSKWFLVGDPVENTGISDRCLPIAKDELETNFRMRVTRVCAIILPRDQATDSLASQITMNAEILIPNPDLARHNSN